MKERSSSGITVLDGIHDFFKEGLLSTNRKIFHCIPAMNWVDHLKRHAGIRSEFGRGFLNGKQTELIGTVFCLPGGEEARL